MLITPSASYQIIGVEEETDFHTSSNGCGWHGQKWVLQLAKGVKKFWRPTKVFLNTQHSLTTNSKSQDWYHFPGEGTQLFSGSGVRPAFPKCGACELKLASERESLWTENFQIWGLVNWKFPNLGACELKISKFGGLWAKIWAKIEAVEAKISKFSQKGVLWTDSFAWNGTLANCKIVCAGVDVK